MLGLLDEKQRIGMKKDWEGRAKVGGSPPHLGGVRSKGFRGA